VPSEDNWRGREAVLVGGFFLFFFFFFFSFFPPFSFLLLLCFVVRASDPSSDEQQEVCRNPVVDPLVVAFFMVVFPCCCSSSSSSPRLLFRLLPIDSSDVVVAGRIINSGAPMILVDDSCAAIFCFRVVLRRCLRLARSILRDGIVGLFVVLVLA